MNIRSWSLLVLVLFFLDTHARVSTDLEHLSEGISFQNDLPTVEDHELISFISKETGKMKALAASDLASYAELARQFLNIRKTLPDRRNWHAGQK